MAYDLDLAHRIRHYLANHPHLEVEEKEMFQGLTFMVNGKMCVCVSGDELMCRFDPALHEELEEQNGFRTMTTKNRVYKGYGFIEPAAFRSSNDFNKWMQLCLDFNPRAKASRKK